MRILLPLALQLLYAISSVHSEAGFVTSVVCTNQGLTVVMDPSEETVAKWISDPAAQPVAYVLNHKSRMPCGSSLKNEKGETNFNLTVPFGSECDVQLTDLEPNHVTAETTIVLENNADSEFGQKQHHVFCIYTKQVQAMRLSDILPQHETVASTGGKPEPIVNMVFRSTNGEHLTTARYGDEIEFYVALTPDDAYHGIVPTECSFSDREDVNSVGAQHFTFVKASCPLLGTSSIMDPLKNVNDEVFFSKFKSFRFGNQSTVFVHCTVKVCMNAENCRNSCYTRVTNSKLTAERLLFRRRRDVSPVSKRESPIKSETQMSITSQLQILSSAESKEVALAQKGSSTAVETCALPLMATPTTVIVVLVGLIALTTVSIGCAVYFGMKLKETKGDSFDLVSAYAAHTSVISLPTGSSYDHPRQTYGYGNEFR